MAPTPIKLRADFDVICFSYDGIDALRETFFLAKKEVNDDKLEV